jgi:hypothetical protein
MAKQKDAGWARPITAAQAAITTLRCARCVRDFEMNGMPEEEMKTALGNLQVAFTKIGIQVWCLRHNCNVIHIDFEGHKHPANPEASTGDGSGSER